MFSKINEFTFKAKGGMAVGILILVLGTLLEAFVTFIVMTHIIIQGGSVNPTSYIVHTLIILFFIYILSTSKVTKKE